MIIIKRVLIGNDHEDTKWLVLEGSVEGIPQVTKRRTINTAALVSGATTVEAEIMALKSDVTEYLARYQAVQDALNVL